MYWRWAANWHIPDFSVQNGNEQRTFYASNMSSKPTSIPVGKMRIFGFLSLPAFACLCEKWPLNAELDKVSSVQEGCTKCFAVHISKFEILQVTWRSENRRSDSYFSVFINESSSSIFFISFFQVIYKISNFNIWTAKHFAQASCAELTLARLSLSWNSKIGWTLCLSTKVRWASCLLLTKSIGIGASVQVTEEQIELRKDNKTKSYSWFIGYAKY